MEKIALYIPNLNTGGAEKVFVNLANSFCSKGYNVDILLTNEEGDFLKELNPKIKVIELSSKRVLLDFFKLSRYMKAEKPDVLMSALNHCNVLAALSSVVFNFNDKTFITIHSNLSETFKESGYFNSILTKLFMSLTFRYVSGAICVSQGVKKDFTSLFPQMEKKTTYIYNPFDIKLIEQKAKLPSSHPWLRKDRSFKTIISSGRLIKAKDFTTLIQAFALVKDSKNVRLIILGDGPLRNELQTLIEKLNLSSFVDLHGFVENPFALISKSNLFVSSSMREGFSNVILEAMICKTPIVATDCPSGPSEILEDGKWGRLVPINNPEKLANAILYTFNNMDSTPSYANRLEYFTTNIISDKYINFFVEMIDSNRV